MKMVWIIIASSLIVAGILVFVVAITASNFNFNQMLNSKYETNTYEITDSFDSFSIDVDTADIRFVPSEDGKCKVVCYEQPKIKHSVAVKDGALNIEVVDVRKWYEHIGINIEKSSITVYLPTTEYKAFKLNTHTGDIEIPSAFGFESIEIKASTADVDCKASTSGLMKITTSTGDIEVENASIGELALSVSTGDIDAKNINCGTNAWIYVSTGDSEVENLKCKNFTSDGGTGHITLTDVLVSEKMSIVRTTGDVTFENSDANEISVKVGTGDVRGSLRTSKIFMVETSTGKVKVPESTTGGKCKINTSTGDISIVIK